MGRPSSVLKINVAKFQLTNRAVTDLSDIADFTIQNFGIEQARFYRDGFNNCFEILAENPQLGRSDADLATNLRRYEHQAHGSKFLSSRTRPSQGWSNGHPLPAKTATWIQTVSVCQASSFFDL